MTTRIDVKSQHIQPLARKSRQSVKVKVAFMIQLSTLRVLIKPVLVIALFGVCTLPAMAQRRIQSTVDASNGDGGEQKLSPLEDELRAKRDIEAADKAHKENVNRARNLVALSESLVTAYKANKQLSREDLKKLERAEKLVKKIRDDAGGSEQEDDPEERPRDLTKALDRMLELSDSLKERVEKTPKRVVSAAVIDEANVLLELIRVLRMQTRTT